MHAEPGAAGRQGAGTGPEAQFVEHAAKTSASSVSWVEEAERVALSGARDRTWIAKNVFYMFNAAVGITELVYVFQAWRGGDWTQLPSQTTELLRSVVVPIVTLILGYYFGQTAKP